MLQDLRLALRGLSRAPGFSAVVIVSLALGIGGGSAIFTLVDAVLLRPLPFPDPSRLYTFKGSHSLPDLHDLQAASPSVAGMGAYASWAFDTNLGAEPERIEGALVSGGVLGALGVRAALGRLLGPEDDRAGAAPVAMVSQQFFRDKLGADPRVLGRTLQLSGKSYAVAGVLPADFELWGSHADLLVPIEVHYAEGAQARGAHFAVALLRLAKDATAERVQAEIGAAAVHLAELYPAAGRDRRYVLQPLLDRYVSEARPALLLFLGAVVLVMGVACANFANLLLARGLLRQRELAIRAALGAGRGRLIRLQLIESVLLALAGGAAGLLLSSWLLPALLALAPTQLPRLDNVQVDGRALIATFLAALATGLVSGLVPALHLSQPNLESVLRDAGGRAGASRAHGRLRRALVVLELSLGIALLVSAGLLLRSFARLQQTPLGFDAGAAVAVRVALPEARYPKAAQSAELFRRLLAAVEVAPGVERAGLISEAPLAGNLMTHDIILGGRPELAPGTWPEAHARLASREYFAALGIPLLRGRLIGPEDGPGTARVALVNDAFVRQHFPGEEPLGKTLRYPGEDSVQWMTIVGVVGDVRHAGPGQPEGAAVYQPYGQNTMSWKRWMTLAVVPRQGTSAVQARAAIKRALATIDPELPLERQTSFAALVDRALAEPRFSLLLIGLFAAVGLLLAAVGIYGVVSYSVEQRTREMAVRLALGAERRDVVGLVLGESLGMLLYALPLGLCGAFAASRLLAGMLFGVGAADPWTYLGTALLVALVALASSWLPARRASRIEPMEALREG